MPSCLSPDSDPRRVYLDHNATTPLLDVAREAMARALEESASRWGNPSSPHAFGHEARLALEGAREEVAGLIGAPSEDVVFVSGGTESDNQAIRSATAAYEERHGSAGHIVTSAVEHPAVMESCRHLGEHGWRVTYLPVDAQGRVDPGDLRSALRPDTALVSLMAVNNETGVIQPYEESVRVAREAGVAVHVDAVQAAGRIPLEVRSLGVDLLSISAHKLGGPAGIGCLYIRERERFRPLILGGGQEGKRRAGTEAALLAVGFGAAARAARAGLPDEPARLGRLRDGMEAELARRVEGIRFNGSGARRVSGTSSVTIPGMRNESLVILMDLAGFAISTGSACSTGAARPSHVLPAMGLTEEAAGSTVRVSLGPSTTRAQVEAFTGKLVEATAGRDAPVTIGQAR